MRTLFSVLIGGLLAFLAGAVVAAPLHPFEADSLARIVAGQKGKPFVLLVWSLECEYCQASLDTLAQARRTRKDLHVVTVSTDPLEDEQAAALMHKRLTALGMSGQAWAFGAASPEQLRYAIDPRWHGEMPRSYWFDAKGEKVAYSGVITPALIARMARPH